jgi:hypothetical protein
MKKCKDCDREIDKYAVACEYCGKLKRARETRAAAGQRKALTGRSGKGVEKD